MVYKKYIKKNGKTYGPYKYHSKRVDGKVVSEYHGSSRGKSDYAKFFWIFLAIFFLMAMAYTISTLKVAFFPEVEFGSRVTGRAIFGLEADYVYGEALDGTLRLSLKKGELIPVDSKIIFESEQQRYEYLLSDFVSVEGVEGDFYAEGKSLSGSGLGYGVKGEKEIYPNVDFEYEITSVSSGGSGSSDSGESEETETPVDETTSEETETTPEEVTTTPEEEITTEETADTTSEETTVDESASEESSDSSSEESSEGSDDSSSESSDDSSGDDGGDSGESGDSGDDGGSALTGNVIASEKGSVGFFSGILGLFSGLTGKVVLESDSSVSGSVSGEDPYSLTIQEGQSVRIVSGSVTVNGESVSDSYLDVDVSGNEVEITTDYFESESGYGEDYLGGAGDVLIIDISELNVLLDEGPVEVKIVSQGESIVSLTTVLGEGSIEAQTGVLPGLNVTVEGDEEELDINQIFGGVSLSEEDVQTLLSELGSSSVEVTKAELVNGRVLVRYEIGGYWVEYTYEDDSNLEERMEEDRIKWLNLIVQSLGSSSSEGSSLDDLIGSYEIEAGSVAGVGSSEASSGETSEVGNETVAEAVSNETEAIIEDNSVNESEGEVGDEGNLSG